MAICRMNGMSIQRIESRYAISAKCNLGENFVLKNMLEKKNGFDTMFTCGIINSEGEA